MVLTISTNSHWWYNYEIHENTALDIKNGLDLPLIHHFGAQKMRIYLSTSTPRTECLLKVLWSTPLELLWLHWCSPFQYFCYTQNFVTVLNESLRWPPIKAHMTDTPNFYMWMSYTRNIFRIYLINCYLDLNQKKKSAFDYR